MQKLRYRLYREHKFVSAQLSDLERFIAKADFTDPEQLVEVKTRLQEVISLMENHAKHEDHNIHPLLKAKGSNVIENIEKEHRDHQSLFDELNRMLYEIGNTTDKNEQINLGYKFYLGFRHLVVLNLNHINEEENKVMPEIQRLYSDNEIKTAVDFPVYEMMTANDMCDMLSILFPTMNIDDKEALLKDLQESQPNKFMEVWNMVSLELNLNEKNILIEKLSIKSNC